MISHATLLIATLLVSLVAGFLFAFAIVAMPGISKLDNRSFIRSFQAMDGIIQNNHPVFVFVWVGSAIALIASVALCFAQLSAIDRSILVTSCVVYIFGVQVPTVMVNIPLNNRIQSYDVDEIEDSEVEVARDEFESRWKRWNVMRTIVCVIAAGSLQFLLLRL